MRRGAVYEASYHTEVDAVVIHDLGGPNDMTVTNDAENVVKQVLKLPGVTASTTIVYYDSEGQPDLLVHDGERFLSFAPIGETLIEWSKRR